MMDAKYQALRVIDALMNFTVTVRIQVGLSRLKRCADM